MNILFISDSLRRGGKERQLSELIKLLVKLQHNVTLIIFDKNIAYPDILELGIDIIVLNKEKLRVLGCATHIINIVKTRKPSIIHSWSQLATLLSYPAAKIFNISLIDSIRYAKKIEEYSKNWFFSELVFSLSDKVIANSIAGLVTHNKQMNNHYKVIHNGYDFSRNSNDVTPQEARKSIGITQNYVIGTIANFYPGKDYGSLIKAAQQLLTEGKSCAFVCIGEGPQRHETECMILPELKSNFYFLGRRDDVEVLVKAFDIGVLFTNTTLSSEGISNALMEIMSAGKPVIATNAGGNSELIADGISGFLVNPFDYQDIVDKIKILINDEERRIGMGNKGKEVIINDFPIQKMADKYIKIYEELAYCKLG